MKIIHERRGFIVNYALEFNRHSKHLNDIDEIIAKYEGNEGEFRDFFAKHENQKITISAPTYITPEFMAEILELKKEKYNFSIRTFILPSTEQRDILKQAGIPYYSVIFIKDWDDFYYHIHCGVSEVYISGPLGFELEAVSAIAKKNNVKIRVIPNIAQGYEGMPALKKFFIRPEDIELYSQYIDTFELRGPHDKMDTIYEVYRKGRWFGNIRELIMEFNENFDSKYIIGYFGKKRINCGKKCLKGNRCRTCEVIDSLAQTLEKNNYVILPNKKEKNDD